MNKMHPCPNCNCPIPAKDDDRIDEFIRTHLLPDPNGRLNTGDVFSSYAHWIQIKLQLKLQAGPTKVTRRLRTLGYPLRRDGRGNWVIGYRLTD